MVSFEHPDPAISEASTFGFFGSREPIKFSFGLIRLALDFVPHSSKSPQQRSSFIQEVRFFLNSLLKTVVKYI